MKYRTLHGERLSTIGFGCYALGGAYGAVDSDRLAPLVARAHAAGVTLFDTADIYGTTEERLGRAVAPFRREILLATKVGAGVYGRPDCSPEHVTTSCERSLARLGTEAIDLYQIHFHDPSTPIVETVGALEELRAAGKIRHYGVGHLPAPRIAEFLAAGEVFSSLTELSPVACGARRELLALCRRAGVGVIAFGATGRGLLTGTIGPEAQFPANDIRCLDPLFQRERFASGLRRAARLTAIGERHGRTPAQVAFAWTLAQPGVVCVLTGPTCREHLDENLAAADWTLPEEDREVLEEHLRDEEHRLRAAQLATLERLLSADSIPPDAFRDMVYVCETLIEQRVAAEESVLPLFQRLFALRRQQEEAVVQEALRALQAEARERFLPLLRTERAAGEAS